MARDSRHGMTVVPAVLTALLLFFFFSFSIDTKKRKIHETWVASQEALL